jgi:hypothetical protein
MTLKTELSMMTPGIMILSIMKLSCRTLGIETHSITIKKRLSIVTQRLRP